MKIRSLLVALPIILGLTTAPVKAAANQPQKEIATQIIAKNQERLEEFILKESAKNKAVMFGETHELYGADSDLITNLLPKFKNQDYKYLALELERNPVDSKLTENLMRIFNAYAPEELTQEKLRSLYDAGELTREDAMILDYRLIKTFVDYAHGKLKREDIDPLWTHLGKTISPGWFDFIDSAKKAKLNIVCYDASFKEFKSFNEREKIAFYNLKELVYDKDPDAKVIILCGTPHLNETPLHIPGIKEWEKDLGLTSKDEEHIPLGVYMNNLTGGRVLTISLGTPLEYMPPYCDFIIDLTYFLEKTTDER